MLPRFGNLLAPTPDFSFLPIAASITLSGPATNRGNVAPRKKTELDGGAAAPRRGSLPATNAKRLREGALATKQSILSLRLDGLLRRFRLRSLSYGGQVAPHNDVFGLFEN
jgi:hypothetical protein